MLGSIRNFSSSIFAKILLVIIIVPFVFWGMGPLFRGGSLNTIAKIDNEKISTQEFINYVKNYAPSEQTLDTNLIQKLLQNFIGEKLIVNEIEDFEIHLSDKSLSTIIKNEEMFKKDNKFSRTKYEKFLVENALSAVVLESNIAKQNKKEQLFDFIGTGIVPSKFLVNKFYDKMNQKRDIQILDLNEFFKKKMNFSENQIKLYFNKNKDTFQNTYKSVSFIKLNPKNLTGNDEFSDLFFKKIDEIDDLIMEGKNLNFIQNKFNLKSSSKTILNMLDIDKNSEVENKFPKDLIKNIFDIDESEPTILLEQKDSYLIVELTKTENVQRKIKDPSVKNEIISQLKQKTKRKLFSEIIAKINNEKFKKNDFDQLSADENIVIKKIRLENRNDNKVLRQGLVNQVYTFFKGKVAAIADIGMSEAYLVYIDQIENASVEQNSEEYIKYFNLSKAEVTNNLYNTYDVYLNSKYNIEINYNALNNIKNNSQ